MNNNVNAHRAGIGTITQVKDAYCSDDAKASGWGHFANALDHAENAFKHSENAKRAMIAGMCCLINRDFIASGRLYSVDSDGRLTCQYYALDHDRKLIACLFFG